MLQPMAVVGIPHSMQHRQSGDKGSKMGSHQITMACTACGQCFFICPVGAVVEREPAGYDIDSDVCIDCGHCRAVCPPGAIEGVLSPFDQG
jgi:ferredoxin